MGPRSAAGMALVVLLVASASEGHHRSLRGRVVNAATQALDVDAIIEGIDIEAVVDRIDINEIVDRIDLNEVVDRIDINEIVDRIDVNETVKRIDLNDLVEQIDFDKLISQVDMNVLLSRVDMDALLDRVDINALLDRVDPDRLLDRVDPNKLLDRVDPDRLLERVDPNKLLDRVDPDRLLERVDINATADRLDIDRIIDRVDVADVVDRAGIPKIIRESTGDMAGSMLDVGRRQVVALDQVGMRVANRMIGRKASDLPEGPPLLGDEDTGKEAGLGNVTGHYAGPLSRLLAFSLDVAIIVGLFTLGTTLFVFLAESLFGWQSTNDVNQTLVGVLLYLLWAFFYSAGTLIIAGRSVGKGVLGLRVVSRNGGPLRARQAIARVLVTPIALATFLVSYLGLFIGKERRSLTDVIADTAVVYDWGDRPAEMSAPLANWIAKQDTDPTT